MTQSTGRGILLSWTVEHTIRFVVEFVCNLQMPCSLHLFIFCRLLLFFFNIWSSIKISIWSILFKSYLILIGSNLSLFDYLLLLLLLFNLLIHDQFLMMLRIWCIVLESFILKYRGLILFLSILVTTLMNWRLQRGMRFLSLLLSFLFWNYFRLFNDMLLLNCRISRRLFALVSILSI